MLLIMRIFCPIFWKELFNLLTALVPNLPISVNGIKTFDIAVTATLPATLNAEPIFCPTCTALTPHCLRALPTPLIFDIVPCIPADALAMPFPTFAVDNEPRFFLNAIIFEPLADITDCDCARFDTALFCLAFKLSRVVPVLLYLVFSPSTLASCFVISCDSFSIPACEPNLRSSLSTPSIPDLSWFNLLYACSLSVSN